VIRRAALILRALDGESEGLSLSQLAARIDLPRSTVHRVVTALTAEGLLAPASAEGGVRIGPEITRLALANRREVHVALRPHLERVYAALNETVDLSIVEGHHLRFVDQIAAPHPLRAVSVVGSTFPLHCSANGKAALAELPGATVERLLPKTLDGFTEHTITDRDDLLREIEEIRRTRVAFGREELTIGISAASVAVRDAEGTIVAMAVPMPTQRLAGREDDVVAVLLDARARMAATLGVER
jgi:DNA-binding IclR family transcriptional regulator